MERILIEIHSNMDDLKERWFWFAVFENGSVVKEKNIESMEDAAYTAVIETLKRIKKPSIAKLWINVPYMVRDMKDIQQTHNCSQELKELLSIHKVTFLDYCQYEKSDIKFLQNCRNKAQELFIELANEKLNEVKKAIELLFIKKL